MTKRDIDTPASILRPVVRRDEVTATRSIKAARASPVSNPVREAGQRAIAAIAIVVAMCGFAHAADIKMAGKLVVPANAGVVAICTDPVVQNVLNEDLRAARHGLRPIRKIR